MNETVKKELSQLIEKLDKATYFYERGVGSIILHQDAHCQEAKDSVHP